MYAKMVLRIIHERRIPVVAPGIFEAEGPVYLEDRVSTGNMGMFKTLHIFRIHGFGYLFYP